MDFVRAFQNLGITAVVKKPKRTSPAEPPLQFDVFRPLKIEVYVVLFASGLVVSQNNKSAFSNMMYHRLYMINPLI